jgi:hypothetical protein
LHKPDTLFLIIFILKLQLLKLKHPQNGSENSYVKMVIRKPEFKTVEKVTRYTSSSPSGLHGVAQICSPYGRAANGR